MHVRSGAWLRCTVLRYRRDCHSYAERREAGADRNPPQCWVVLAKPPINVSTADVYGKLRANELKSASFCSCYGVRPYHAVHSLKCVMHLGNVLESVTLHLYPEVLQLKESMIRLGADGVLMSGSGPTVFGLVPRKRSFREFIMGSWFLQRSLRGKNAYINRTFSLIKSV